MIRAPTPARTVSATPQPGAGLSGRVSSETGAPRLARLPVSEAVAPGPSAEVATAIPPELRLLRDQVNPA